MKTFTRALLFLIIFLLSCPTVFADENAFHFKLATQDFPPFSYLKNPDIQSIPDQEVAGPAADIIHRVCTEMRTAYTLSLLPWRRAQYDTRQANIYNGLFLIGWNKKRSEWLHFSPPVLQTEYGFFVSTDNTMEFKTAADLNQYTVGVFGPSNTSRSLEKIKSELNNFTIDMRPDDISGFKKLSLGRVDAVYSNKDVGFAILQKNGIKNVKYAGRHKKLNYYIGFDKKTVPESLANQFNSTFEQLHQEKVIHSILNQYQMTPSVLDE